jgi:hypothetical protein
MNPKFKYITDKQIFSPTFDDNPAENWDNIPDQVRENLIKTCQFNDILHEIRPDNYFINSTWRLHDKRGKAHREGLAIDKQPAIVLDKKTNKINYNWGCEIIDQSINRGDLIIKELGIKSFALYWEYENKNAGWLHLEHDHDIDENFEGFKCFYGVYSKEEKKMKYYNYQKGLNIMDFIIKNNLQ